MKINAISFQGVYRTTNKQFTPNQYKISEDIKYQLTSSDYADKRGCTPSDKLKKQGYDIIIEPASSESVVVSAVKDFKKGIGVQPHTYQESVYVGTYNQNKEFDNKDIHKALNEKDSINATFMIPIIVFFGLIANGIIKSCSNVNASPKQNSTIIKQSVQDNVKTLSGDTFRLIKK